MKKLIFFLLISTFFCDALHAQTLTGMNPNTIVQGQTNLDATITGPGVFIQQASQSGNVLDIHLQQGATTISIFDYTNWFAPNVTTYNDSSVIDNYAFSALAPLGLYDLSVTVGDIWNPQTYTLPAVFEVVVPDGYGIGNVYEDLNLNGTKDPGEPDLISQTIFINPGNLTITTDVNGNFNYPLANGTYNVTWLNNPYNSLTLSSDSSSYTFTINSANVTGLDFGLYRSLTVITPDNEVKGYTVTCIVESRGLYSGTGSGNVSQVRLYKFGATTVYNVSGSINILNNNALSVKFIIPPSAPAGAYDVIVTLSNNSRHYLPATFNILNAEAYLTGTVYLDVNSDGQQNAGEPGIFGEPVLALPDSITAITDFAGHYNLGVIYGNHQVKWNPVMNAPFTLTSDSASYTVNALADIDSLDFGIRSTNPQGSVDILMTSSLARCNATHQHRINYNNSSNDPISGTIKFIKDPLMTNISTIPIPNAVNGDTMIFNFTNIAPFAGWNVSVNSIYPGAGSYVLARAYIESVDGSGNVLYSDSSIIGESVICSFDPNDKACLPEGVGPDHLTLQNDLLDYTIRFQNTGTDTAFNVVIYDDLDENLDLSTFNVIAASHSVETTIDTDGRIAFSFLNILLADSNINEPASHGFVRYTVKAKSGLSDSTAILNQAFIVFDGNSAVVTNETNNTLVYVIPVGINEIYVTEESATIYPNPFSDFTNILFTNKNGERYILNLYDVSGKIVKQESTSSGSMILTKDNLNKGIYFYQLQNVSGTRKLTGKLIIE